MSAIDLVLGSLIWSDYDTEAAERMSAVEIKAALLTLVEDFSLFAGTVSGAKAVDPSDDVAAPLYGPATRRRLDARWRESYDRVNAYVEACTGYSLDELTTLDAIERCMKLCGPEQLVLYASLQKLYRLHIAKGGR